MRVPAAGGESAGRRTYAPRVTDPVDSGDDVPPAIVDLLRTCPTAAAALDDSGRVTAWNAAAEQLLGRPSVDAVGRPLAELVSMPHQLSSQLSRWGRLEPDERSALGQGVRLPAVHPSGTTVSVRLSVSELPGGAAVAWLQSASEVPAHEPDDDVFRIIFERAPEAITITDADLRQRTVNPAGLDMVGLPPGLEDVGRGAVYVHPDDQEILDDRARRRRAGQAVPIGPVRYRVNHTDGTWRWLESLSVDLRDVPSVNGFLVLSRDVTADEEQRVALEEATARLNELDRSRNHLLSAVSHELRTPLAAILSASELLGSDPVDADELRAYAQLIHRNAERLDALVADLLLIGRLQNGTLPVELGPVDLSSLLRRVAAAHDRPDGPPITLQVAPGPPARADAGRLQQVVENLVTNALKFGGPDGAHIAAHPDRDGWTITVTDHGPGIEPAVADRVFEPFFRVPATERLAAGTGLGLAITRGIIDLHGGTLSLAAAEGGGTDAAVTIPMWSEEGPGDGN